MEGNLTLPLHSTLKWTTNFTYMRKSVNKDTGNPLSVIPKYTINSSLNWQPTEKLDAALNVTYYGKQESRGVIENNKDYNEKLTKHTVSPYGLVGISAGYRFNKKPEWYAWASTTCLTNACTAAPTTTAPLPTTNPAAPSTAA